jgi:hypothetical protein
MYSTVHEIDFVKAKMILRHSQFSDIHDICQQSVWLQDVVLSVKV